MRILIIQDGIITELHAPDTLAGMVWAIKDHFDNIDRGSMSVIWNKPAAIAAAKTAGEFKSPLETGEKTLQPQD